MSDTTQIEANSQVIDVDTGELTEVKTTELQTAQTGQQSAQDESFFSIIGARLMSWARGNPRLVNPTAPAQIAQGGQQEPENIGQMAIDADTPIASIVAMLADSTGDTEDVIAGIQDDKEHPIGQVIIQLMIILGYIAPPVLSVLIGIAVGLQYSGGLDNVLGVAVFIVCIFYEIGLVWLMFAIIKQARRVMSTRKGALGLIALIVFYLAVAVGSAAAQWAIYESRVDLTQSSQVAGAVIRTFAVPIVDTICAIALPILLHVSLDKRLAEIQKKTEATIAINKQKIAARLALIQEAIITKATLQKEKDYQSKNDMANQLIDMISQKIINDTRNSLNSGPTSGYGSRRDGMR
jgi:chromate transport protein ChrA